MLYRCPPVGPVYLPGDGHLGQVGIAVGATFNVITDPEAGTHHTWAGRPQMGQPHDHPQAIYLAAHCWVHRARGNSPLLRDCGS